MLCFVSCQTNALDWVALLQINCKSVYYALCTNFLSVGGDPGSSISVKRLHDILFNDFGRASDTIRCVERWNDPGLRCGRANAESSYRRRSCRQFWWACWTVQRGTGHHPAANMGPAWIRRLEARRLLQTGAWTTLGWQRRLPGHASDQVPSRHHSGSAVGVDRWPGLELSDGHGQSTAAGAALGVIKLPVKIEY